MRSKFPQAILVLVVAFLVFEYGIRPPMPASLLWMYMGITLFAVLLYVSSDSDSWRSCVTPIWRMLTEPARRPVRLALGVIFPLLVGYYAYSQAFAKPGAPVELRAIHPAPPSSIAFRGKTIDLEETNTPVRGDIAQNPASRARHLAEGGAIYIRNCMYCHGDNLDGDGHFAHGFNPRPADFTDPGTIAQLSEGFLFWRIAKGGPGLPKESTPWNSAMPAWEDRLTEEQIWQVIYYLYETTGYPPRVMQGGHAAAPRPAGPRRAWLASRQAHAQAAGNVELGKRVYERRCELCHGASGKGDGPAAELLLPRPRDFTAGKYKIKTTESGERPTDQDLFHVITEGMPGTSMPPWRVLPEAERWALVAYLKTLGGSLQGAPPGAIALPPEIKASEASIARGREMFEAIECNKCHGDAGRGNPAPGSDLKDDWDNPIRPANLTKAWTFRGGPTRRDVAMRLATGLMGSPMPTFKDTVKDYKEFKKGESEEQKDPKIWEAWKDANLWDLANYVRSLGPERPGWAELLSVAAVEGEIPDDPAAEFWQAVPAARFPLVGQVIVDPRNFNPTVDMVAVRAAHSDEEVAFHVTWDDPTPSDPAQGASKPDRLALQFPTGRGEGERPYFLMGDGRRPVYLLTWTAGAGVGEATAAGPGKVTPQSGEAIQAAGRAVYDKGQYRAVLKRPRATPDAADFAFPARDFFPIAFWAWDGGTGEEGVKAAISSWYYAKLEAPPSARPFAIPPIAALVAAVAELGVARWARRRRGRDA